MKVYFTLTPEQADPSNGIGQVVHAQFKHLPDIGIKIVQSPDMADVTTCHISKGKLENIDVLMCHGLYYEDVPHSPYKGWHYQANRDIMVTARTAYEIIVPSSWVAEAFIRDMGIQPNVIGHGINLNEWSRGRDRGYLLYNKGRESDVCSSKWAMELAEAGVQVISTFAPIGSNPPSSMKIIGTVPFDQMKKYISEAHIYLATTLETFGIGTLEALACGVPVLGFDWGGTSDIVTHLKDGYLVPVGDTQALLDGIKYINDNYEQMSRNAIEKAQLYDWKNIMPQYKAVFEKALDKKKQDKANDGVSIIITNYNYEKYVGEAIESCLSQTELPKEIIVVDDGSKDKSKQIIQKYASQHAIIKTIFKKNGGVSSARNAGIKSAKFPFIVCLDADDKLAPDFVKTLHHGIRRNRGLGIVYSGLHAFNEDGRWWNTDWPPQFDWNIQANPTNPPSNCIPSGCMFRREMWRRAGGYRQEYAPGEDAEFWVRGLSMGFDAQKVTDERLFHYRLHEDSASRTKKYKFITDKNQWMVTKNYPIGSPVSGDLKVRSYLLPDISVIIPVGKGHEKNVVMAIESVRAQSFTGWEIILVNDTGIKLSKLKAKYPFIRVIDNHGKHGAGVARNIGIKSSKAPYLLFLDADDYLMPKALEYMLKATEVTKERYIYTDYYLYSKGTMTKHQTKGYNQMEWIMQNPVTVLMHTKIAQSILFDENLPSWEDWDFFIKCAIAGYCGSRLPEPLLVYQLDAGKRRKLMLRENGELSADGSAVLKILKEKYESYYTGGKTMAGCCGGSDAAETIIKAKNTINAIPNVSPNEYPSSTRMEFTGTNFGAISMTVNGRVYRGGQNPSNKYVDANSADVETLVRSGKWKVMDAPAPAPVQDMEQEALETMVADTLKETESYQETLEISDEFEDAEPIEVFEEIEGEPEELQEEQDEEPVRVSRRRKGKKQ